MIYFIDSINILNTLMTQGPLLCEKFPIPNDVTRLEKKRLLTRRIEIIDFSTKRTAFLVKIKPNAKANLSKA